MSQFRSLDRSSGALGGGFLTPGASQSVWGALLMTIALFCAAYYVAFGPHGPRTPISQPGDNLKIFLSTIGLVGVSGLIFLFIQSRGM